MFVSNCGIKKVPHFVESTTWVHKVVSSSFNVHTRQNNVFHCAITIQQFV